MVLIKFRTIQDGDQKAYKPCSLSGEGFLTSDFYSGRSSFLFFDGCSVVRRLAFPFSLPSFSLPFLYSSFLFTLESSFSSDSSDLWVKWKKFLMVLQGIKVWSLSGLSSGSSLKLALSRFIDFLISHNNTNSQSSSNLKRRKKIIRPEDIVWVNTIFLKILS